MKLKPYYTLICFLIFSNLLIGQNATITINQDEKIVEILALKKNLEVENKLGVGYTIQLLSLIHI